MACGISMLIIFILILTGCQQAHQSYKDDVTSQIVRIGKNATLEDLAYIVNKWDSIKSSIVGYDSEQCVRDNLALGVVRYIEIFGVDYLELARFPVEMPEESIIKVIGIETDYLCIFNDVSVSTPFWIVVETTEGFVAVGNMQIAE